MLPLHSLGGKKASRQLTGPRRIWSHLRTSYSSLLCPPRQAHWWPCCSPDMPGTRCHRAFVLVDPTAGILFAHLSAWLTLSFPSHLCSYVTFSVTPSWTTLQKWQPCFLPLTPNITCLAQLFLFLQHLPVVIYEIISLLGVLMPGSPGRGNPTKEQGTWPFCALIYRRCLARYGLRKSLLNKGNT